jgi:hypothetical protein
MASVATSHRMLARRVVRSVELTRRQIAGIVLIACVPLPLLSLATTIVPLPQLVERAAARFIPFVPATLEDEPKRVVRAAPARAHPADRPPRQREAAGSRVQAAPPTRTTNPTRTPVKRTAESAPRASAPPASAPPASAPPASASTEPASSEPTPREPAGGTSTVSEETPAPTPTSAGSASSEPAAPTKKNAKEKPAPPAQASENSGGAEKTKGQDAAASQPAPESPGAQSAAQSAAESPGRSGESNGGGNDKPGGSGRP